MMSSMFASMGGCFKQFVRAFQYNLMGTVGNQRASRYGGFAYDELKENVNGITGRVSILSNLTGLHAGPTFLNVHTNALMARLGAESTVEVANEPLPITAYEREQSGSSSTWTTALMLVIAFSIIPAFTAAYIVKEKESEVKQQLYVSGVSYTAYWLANFVYDLSFYMLPFLGTFAVLAAYGVEALVGEGVVGPTLLVLAIYGPATTGFSYLISNFFSKAVTVQMVVFVCQGILGSILSMVVFFLSMGKDTRQVCSRLAWVFRLVPSFCLGDAIFMNTMLHSQWQSNSPEDQPEEWWDECLEKWDRNEVSLSDCAPEYLSIYGSGASVLMLGIEGIVYFLLSILVDNLKERPSFRRKIETKAKATPAAPGEEDADVVSERNIVANGGLEDRAIVMNDVTKVYTGGSET